MCGANAIRLTSLLTRQVKFCVDMPVGSVKLPGPRISRRAMFAMSAALTELTSTPEVPVRGDRRRCTRGLLRRHA